MRTFADKKRKIMTLQEKMQSFTDAGLYEQDQYIDFEPEGHIYTYKGQQRLLSVSSLIAYFFERFDAEAAARRQWERYGIPIEETLTKWDRNSKMACEVGTFVHEQTENFFRDGSFGTDYAFEMQEPSSISAWNGKSSISSVLLKITVLRPIVRSGLSSIRN